MRGGGEPSPITYMTKYLRIKFFFQSDIPTRLLSKISATVGMSTSSWLVGLQKTVDYLDGR